MDEVKLLVVNELVVGGGGRHSGTGLCEFEEQTSSELQHMNLIGIRDL